MESSFQNLVLGRIAKQFQSRLQTPKGRPLRNYFRPTDRDAGAVRQSQITRFLHSAAQPSTDLGKPPIAPPPPAICRSSTSFQSATRCVLPPILWSVAIHRSGAATSSQAAGVGLNAVTSERKRAWSCSSVSVHPPSFEVQLLGSSPNVVRRISVVLLTSLWPLKGKP